MKMIHALRWRASIALVCHGVWLAPALAALGAALALWIWWAPAQEAALRQALAQLKQEQGQGRPAALSSGPSAVVLLRPEQGAAAMEQLFALAAQHGLNVVQADYRRQQSGRAARWQVQLPATGTYPQVRRFVRAATAIRGMSLDEVGLHRIGNGNTVEARMLFSVWFISGEGA